MHMYTWASVQNVAKSASARTWWILLLTSLTRMLPLAVQQSISFPSFFSDLVTRANAARLAARSSLMKILFCGCSELWSFSLKRDRYTASRSFSLRKRTIITRSRLVLPSFVTFGPRRWLRSRWSGDIGGCSCIGLQMRLRLQGCRRTSSSGGGSTARPRPRLLPGDQFSPQVS